MLKKIHATLSAREVSVCDPLAWLSELSYKRDYIKSSIQNLDGILATV